MQIIVGSYALSYWGYLRKPPKDIDNWVSSEAELATCGNCDNKIIPEHILKLIPTNHGFATPRAIYTIKCSHLGWDNPNWQKHKEDVLWLKAEGYVIIPELYNSLVNYWKETLGNKEFLSLDKSKEQFFTDYVSYKYDHDYLHELVAYPNKPMYEKCLGSNEAVLTNYEKFNSLSFDDKIKLFKEEVTVIACERWLLNDYWKGQISWYQAYLFALKKTITNLTKNWATDFIVLNLEKFNKPDFSLFENVINKLGDNVMSKVDMKPFEDLLNKLEDDSLDGLIFNLCEGDLYGEQKKIAEEAGYERLMQDGGGEGGAEYCEAVFKLGDKIYKANYSYASYNGHEYDGISNTLKEVQPKEKTITVYE